MDTRKSLRLWSSLATAILLGWGFAHEAKAEAVNFRVEVDGGIVVGDVDVDDPLFGEFEFETDTGYAVGAAAWADGLLFRHLSIGVQYLRTSQSSEEISAEGATVTGGPFEADATVNAFMANLALRKNDGTWHPYIGGGVGVAHSSAEISGTAGAPLLVNGMPIGVFTGASADDSDTTFAGQVFGGFDFDVTENIYVGINGRFFLTDATLLGADADFRNFVGMGVVGLKF